MIIENISTLIATALLVFCLYKMLKKTKRQRGEDSALVVIWWFIVFIFSFSLHLYASWQVPQNETQKLLSYHLSSIASSARSAIKMFVYDFSYGEVKHVADNDILFSVAITVCYFAAVIWSTLMIKNLFFPGIINGIKVWLRAKFPQRKDDYHYIIVGCEKSMKLFLSDLQKTVSKNKITIITGIPVESGFNSTAYFKEFIEDGYAVTNGKANEAELKRAGIDNASRKTRVIAITEDDEQNLAVADIITQKIYTTVCSGKKSSSDVEIELALKNINLEAYIMYSFIERTEHFAFAKKAYGKVDFFNPYEIRVRDFFWNNPITGFIPHLIDKEKARLKGEFSADGKIYKPDGKEYCIKNIFVGFGSANYQMLKESVLTGQLLGCDYNATIYDNNIYTEAGEGKTFINQAMFMNHSCGLFGDDEIIKEEEYYKSPVEKYNIVFKNGNTLTRDFYTKTDNCLMEEVKNNDFTVIYIALGEDKISIETACEIRQCLYEHGITQEKVKLFVKVCEESVFNKDSVINNENNIPIKIECYGLNTSVFRKDYIVNESLDEFAKAVTNKNHETLWEILTETQRDINRQAAMAIKVKLNLIGFDFADKEKTDGIITDEIYYKTYVGEGNEKISKIIKLSKEVANHNNMIEAIFRNINNEKNKLAKQKLEDEIKKTKADLKNIKNERSDYILDYVKTENGQEDGTISDTPRNNMARLEHLRWNTFHLVHGWTKKQKNIISSDNSSRKDELTKKHACITTFEELITLRELQAEKIREKDPNITIEKALAKADTIWYDYNLMDELVVRLLRSNKVLIKT
jgi:hypothetical protein